MDATASCVSDMVLSGLQAERTEREWGEARPRDRVLRDGIEIGESAGIVTVSEWPLTGGGVNTLSRMNPCVTGVAADGCFSLISSRDKISGTTLSEPSDLSSGSSEKAEYSAYIELRVSFSLVGFVGLLR